MAGEGYASVLSGGLDLFGGWINQGYTERNMRRQQAYNTEMYKTRYQMTVDDLKSAGLNPMLAYTQGAGSAPQSSAGSVVESSLGSRTAGVYNQSKIASAQEANIEADTLKKKAETLNVNADTLIKGGVPELMATQILQASASAEQSHAMAEKIRAEIKLVDSEIEKIKGQLEKNKSDIQLNNSLIQANNYANQLRVAETALTKQHAMKTEQDVIIGSPKAKAAQTTTAERGEIAEYAGKVGSNIWKFLSPFK